MSHEGRGLLPPRVSVGLLVAQAQAELLADLRHHVQWAEQQGQTMGQAEAWHAVLEVAIEAELAEPRTKVERAMSALDLICEEDKECIALAQFEALADVRHHLTWLRSLGRRHEEHFRRSLAALLALEDAEREGAPSGLGAAPSDFAALA